MTSKLRYTTLMTVHQALETYFGYSSFRPLQETIINDVVTKKDTFVLMPTGGGKSLCYQIPSLVMEGTTIVVSPLISLMKDQVDALTQNGINAAFLNSTLTAAEQKQIITRVKKGEITLLYVAPERLTQPSFFSLLTQIPLSFFAIDEAHCISQWGHDFRPEYRQLSKLKQQFPHLPIIALTATATKTVAEDIISQLHLHDATTYQASFNRPNLSYKVAEKKKGYGQILEIIKQHPDESGIIYCQTRDKVDDITTVLTKEGINVLPYHAGLSDGDRQKNQERFISDDCDVIVATVAFGMGINKPNVRYIIHYGLPKNLEQYYQETGRAGRDGLPSECALLFSFADKITIEHFIKQANESEQQAAREHLKRVIDYATSFSCRRKVLLSYFGETYEQENCASCDVCTTQKETFDATIITQKILSCIYKTGQVYGAHHISQVLMGMKTLKAVEKGHDTLSTFGLLSDHSLPEIKDFIRELLYRGYIEESTDGYNSLKLTPHSTPVLKGKEEVYLTKLEKKEAKKKKKVLSESTDPILFQKLRELRKKLADEAHVPPYIIFSDVTLQDMAGVKPKNKEELAEIKGVGQMKLEKYGNIFLQEITDYVKNS